MTDDLSRLHDRFGHRYRIERELGRGGMGAVYLARDRTLDRPVALKVLPPALAEIPELRERFLRETRTAASFSHPNIVPVFSVEEATDQLAFAMGFIEGESLAARVVREGPLSQRDAVRLLQDVAYALAYAHGRGVVHRDIKPDNIMIERATGRALVMDFGIARTITPVSAASASAAHALTRVGEVVGTPEYMSPEQAAGDTIDGRADLYSLGLVAWFALTGATAMTGESTQRILVRQLTEPVPPLAPLRPDLPPALCAVVDRCCAKEADARYATAEGLVEALDATQLVSAELPVAIRLLAPALSAVTTRSLSAIAMLIVGAGMIADSGNGNVLAIGLIVTATAWVLGVTTVRDVRLLRRAGYTVSELQRLLGLTLAEHDAEYARRAADAAQRKRRRRRVIVASALLAWQGSMLVVMRSQADASGQIHLSSRVATLTFFASLLASAMAVAVLLASPFRRSVPERLFAATWLGGFGRGLLRLIGPRGLDDGSATAAMSAATPKAFDAPVTAVSAVRTGGAAMAEFAASDSTAAATMSRLAEDVADLRRRVDTLESRER